MKYINSWKNKRVSEKQLELNLEELDYRYPEHWKIFISTVFRMDVSSVLDIGCGVGSYKKLCSRHFSRLKYTGMDYSEEAVKIAKEKWGDHFYQGDYKNLTKEDAKKYELLHAGALLDVLPDGDEAYEFLLSLGFKYVILGRVFLWEELSSSSLFHGAYGEITTYKFKHNVDNLTLIGDKQGYDLKITGDLNAATVLLVRR